MGRGEAQLGGALQRHLLALLAGDVDSDALDTGPTLLQKAGRTTPPPLPSRAPLLLHDRIWGRCL